MNDSLGGRIKRYEAAYNYLLTPKSCVVLRVDGKAFHTWTRGMNRPFDEPFIEAMVEATKLTAAEMMGFKLAYVQSDEASFLLTDFDRHETEGWFNYELNKVVSITASLFTAHFNRLITNRVNAPAIFDARAFIVPADDAPNVFIWRCKDWYRNSVQMLAQAHFSPKQLHGKKLTDLHEMLHGIDINWAKLPEQLKNGTFVTRDGSALCEQLGYEDIRKLIEPEPDQPL
jgi:tRNA(His) guanylyltransferase